MDELPPYFGDTEEVNNVAELVTRKETAKAELYTGDVYLAMLDGSRVPVERLLRDVRGLKQVAGQVKGRLIYVRVNTLDDAVLLAEALKDRENIYQIDCIEVLIEDSVVVLEWAEL
jgi:hypothetical protein